MEDDYGFKNALEREYEEKQKNDLHKSLDEIPPSVQEARKLLENMTGLLEDWNNFINNPNTLRDLKSHPEWDAFEYEAGLKILVTHDENPINNLIRELETQTNNGRERPQLSNLEELIKKNLFNLIEPDIVIPLFAEYLKIQNGWTEETAYARSEELIDTLCRATLERW